LRLVYLMINDFASKKKSMKALHFRVHIFFLLKLVKNWESSLFLILALCFLSSSVKQWCPHGELLMLQRFTWSCGEWGFSFGSCHLTSFWSWWMFIVQVLLISVLQSRLVCEYNITSFIAREKLLHHCSRRAFVELQLNTLF